jgi:hypothetical protein
MRIITPQYIVPVKPKFMLSGKKIEAAGIKEFLFKRSLLS